MKKFQNKKVSAVCGKVVLNLLYVLHVINLLCPGRNSGIYMVLPFASSRTN